MKISRSACGRIWPSPITLKTRSAINNLSLRFTFREFIVREQLFTHESKLLLACSGGLDSTVLAHLLHAEGYDFAIAHMNFQLRGEASDGDAAFVEELARTLDAKFYYKAVDVKAEAKDGESTQMTARRLRHQWFKAFENATGISYLLLTAHHRDDNFETFLINLLRSNGVAGLRGMPPKYAGVARPLLCTNRAKIEAYAREHDISWREDASNATDDYLRNRIRHHLLPVFAEEFGYNADQFATTSRNLQSDYRLRKATLDRFRNTYCEVEYRQKITIRRSDWATADAPYFQDFFYHISIQYGFTAGEVSQMLSFEGKRPLSGRSYKAYVSPEEIVFQKESDTESLTETVVIEQLPFYLKQAALSFECIPRPGSLSQAGQLYLAPSSLPLHLRPRKNGDRFQPLGMGGKTKKIQDYFVDQKVPVWLRDRIYLLVNDRDEIMAIPGYCVSEQFKVRPEDELVLRITTA